MNFINHNRVYVLLSLLSVFLSNDAFFIPDFNFFKCKFSCPKGTTPSQNENATVNTNGCGSYGFKWEFTGDLVGFNDCCNMHDICYQTCLNDKNNCDDTFKTCLTNICQQSNYKSNGCKLVLSKILPHITKMFGCHAYVDAQKSACKCG